MLKSNKKLIAGLCGAVLLMFGSVAVANQVESLRGPLSIDENNEAPGIYKQDKSGLKRAYRQQPPLIPHRIEGYQVDLRVNRCMSCHDWPNNNEMRAPKISETHYENREGAALDYLSRNRWFCTQCHVPQVDAPPLVVNEFKNASEVD